MNRTGDTCKQGMVSLFSYLPKGEKLPAKAKAKWMSKKRINFCLLAL